MTTGAESIVAGLEAAGVTLAASVPDTWIGRLMAAVRGSARSRAVDVAREEEAVAVACGANLAGGRGAVLSQNAGLLNCGAVLAGLVELYGLPCFFIVSLRPLWLSFAFSRSRPPRRSPKSEKPNASFSMVTWPCSLRKTPRQRTTH